MKDDKQFLSDQEVQKLKTCIESGFTNLQSIYDTEIAEERFDQWFLHAGGADLVKRWRVMRSTKALKIFHEPTNHKEAEAVLKRHPDTKAEYSDKLEVSGEGGGAIVVQIIDYSKNANTAV